MFFTALLAIPDPLFNGRLDYIRLLHPISTDRFVGDTIRIGYHPVIQRRTPPTPRQVPHAES